MLIQIVGTTLLDILVFSQFSNTPLIVLGPVYGLSFSPDSQFLLSCSQDSTVRLWSMATKTNLVCYKVFFNLTHVIEFNYQGHVGPVWDVAFGPLGYYFATAGHDKCALLWSTNHVYPLRVFSGHISDVNVWPFTLIFVLNS
jgi:transcription initiation factor TFIID subunit 5